MKLGQWIHYTTQEGDCVPAVVTDNTAKDGTFSVAAIVRGVLTEFHKVRQAMSPTKEVYEETDPLTNRKVSRTYEGFPGHSAHPLDAHDHTLTEEE